MNFHYNSWCDKETFDINEQGTLAYLKGVATSFLHENLNFSFFIHQYTVSHGGLISFHPILSTQLIFVT